MPGAEVVLPDAVDHDPGEQRVLRRRDPVRERGAAAGRDAARRPRLDRDSVFFGVHSAAGHAGLHLRRPAGCAGRA